MRRPSMLAALRSAGLAVIAWLALSASSWAFAANPAADVDPAAQKTPLHLAARAGDLALAKSLIAEGADVNATDRYKETPLHDAVLLGQKDMVAFLLAQGATVDARSSIRYTPLMRAVSLGEDEIARLLVANGADITVKDHLGSTPLHQAAGANVEQAGLVRFLLDHGAEPGAADDRGGTPLHRAAVLGHVQTAQLLLDRGAPVDPKGGHGYTPLYEAVVSGQVAMAKLLLAHGADLHIKIHAGECLLDTACGGPYVSHPSVAMVAFLLDSGLPVEGTSRRGTPLHVASSSHQVAIMKLLLDRGADVNARGEQGEMPLDLAISDEAGPRGAEAVALLLSRGADANHTVPAAAGMTPLHRAAAWGSAAAVKLLLEAGADPNAKTPDGQTALDLATRNDRAEVVTLLTKAGAKARLHDLVQAGDLAGVRKALAADPGQANAPGVEGATPLGIAARAGRLDMVKLLLAKGARVNAPGRYGSPPLLEAVANRHVAVAEYLIAHGADVNGTGSGGSAPLHVVKDERLAALLIRKRANVNLRQDNGFTPLHYAAMGEEDNAAIAELLLANGAEADAKGDNQCTPLLYAASDGSYEVAKLLLSKGASVAASDSNGWTPLHHAAEGGHEEVAALLIAKGAVVDAPGRSPGETPLWLGFHDYEVVRLLLSKGADVNVTVRGETLLHRAVHLRGAVTTLVEAGADVNARDDDGNTPLHLAARDEESAQWVEYLTSKGADINARNNRGETPLHRAVPPAARVLREHGATE